MEVEMKDLSNSGPFLTPSPSSPSSSSSPTPSPSSPSPSSSPDIIEIDWDCRTRYFCWWLPNKYKAHSTINTLLLCIAINTGLRNLTSSSFKALQSEFALSTGQLGTIPFLRNLLGALVLPFGGILCDIFSRRWILTFSLLHIGVFTSLLAFAGSYLTYLSLRACSGLAYEFTVLIASSYVGDYYRRDKRGFAFGAQGVAAAVGAIVGTISMGIFASETIAGYSGWRVIMLIWGLVTLTSALVSALCVFEPVRGMTELEEPGEGEQVCEVEEEKSMSLQIDWDQMRTIYHGNWAWVILVTSVTLHSIPWSAFAFLILWLQYNGLSDEEASMTYSAAGLTFMFGAVIAGWIGDITARSPSQFLRDYGRILLAQGTVGTAVPLLFLFVTYLVHFASFPLFISVTGLIGFLLAFSEQACDNPLLTEVIHPSVRSSSFGFVYTIAGVISSLGSLLVGYIAELYGYQVPDPNVSIQNLPEAIRQVNGTALGWSLITICCGFWGLQILCYIPLYNTYPPQRDSIQERLRREERERKGEEEGEKGGRKEEEEEGADEIKEV